MKHALLLIVLQLASSGADAFYTDHILSRRYSWESNPIARPFVSSRSGRVAYFGGSAALKIALPIELRRHGHPKLAETAAWLGIVDNAQGAAYTARNVAIGRQGLPQAKLRTDMSK